MLERCKMLLLKPSGDTSKIDDLFVQNSNKFEDRNSRIVVDFLSVLQDGHPQNSTRKMLMSFCFKLSLANVIMRC